MCIPNLSSSWNPFIYIPLPWSSGWLDEQARPLLEKPSSDLLVVHDHLALASFVALCRTKPCIQTCTILLLLNNMYQNVINGQTILHMNNIRCIIHFFFQLHGNSSLKKFKSRPAFCVFQNGVTIETRFASEQYISASRDY